jgi:catechol-2,3-dioxygenase
MIEWYRTVFEAEVVHQDPALVFMTYDDEHHRFAFANLSLLKPEAKEGDRGDFGVNHVAYTYADAGDLMKTYARLKAAGIMPYWPVHHGISLSLYYKDPDGNRLELQVDWQANRSGLIRSASVTIPTGCSNNIETALERTFFYGDPKVLSPPSRKNMA